jgi:hypothetical protein
MRFSNKNMHNSTKCSKVFPLAPAVTISNGGNMVWHLLSVLSWLPRGFRCQDVQAGLRMNVVIQNDDLTSTGFVGIWDQNMIMKSSKQAHRRSI